MCIDVDCDGKWEVIMWMIEGDFEVIFVECSVKFNVIVIEGYGFKLLFNVEKDSSSLKDLVSKKDFFVVVV